MLKKYAKPANSSIMFRCISEGIPSPNITWKKNGEEIFNVTTDDLSAFLFDWGFEQWSLSVNKLTKTDDGNYTCIVCNIMGCINYTTVLHVLDDVIKDGYPPKPYIEETYPGNHTAVVNDTVQLSCPVVSDLEPDLYWLRSARGMVEEDNEDRPENIVLSDNDRDRDEHFTIQKVTINDEGWYVCVARNIVGNITAKGYLKVLESRPDKGPQPLLHKTKQTPDVLSAVFGTMFVVVAIIAVMTFKKWKQERIKKQLAIETAARVLITTHWIKKVTVEKPQLNGSPNASGDLLLPVVKIEKKKLSQVQGNTTDASELSEYELPVDVAWEVDRDSLAIGKVLGEGEFGKVVKAECANISKQGENCIVAVKMLKEGYSDDDMMALVSEMEVMKMVGQHANIINLLGCCTQRGPLYVIVEYAPHGCLREFLREHRYLLHKSDTDAVGEEKTLTQKDLVSFSHQVAKGMEYLASRRCIHRDLAARNVLVSAGRVLKIADFGLAKDVRASDYYRKTTAGRLPVRWMAPESLSRMIFTTQTDVWSFGVLLWEIMALGATPYPTVPAQHMHEYLRSGHRMTKPPDCSSEIYTLIRRCWCFSPGDRPTFTELVEDLDNILKDFASQE